MIGEHLSHSFSPRIHAMPGNSDYTLKELAPDEVGEFVKHGDYVGMNVTILNNGAPQKVATYILEEFDYEILSH